MARKNWTKEEVEFLESRWGSTSIKSIAKNLDRSINAVKIKAQRLELGDPTLHYDGVTVNQLAETLGISYSIINNWIKKYDFPVRYKVFAIEKPIKVVKYDEFWKWAEKNKHLLNFSNFEPLSLGPEPDWVPIKRSADRMNYEKVKERPWTKEDEKLLRSMVNAHKYTYPEIAQALKRTEGAIKRRLYELDIKARPVRLDNSVKYTKEEVQTIIKMFNQGYGLNTIAEKIGKSALGVRGKLERMGYRFREDRFIHEDESQIQ